MKQSELNEVLTKHKRWLSCEEGGEFANLRGADLRGTDLQGTDLRDADLRGADLRGTDLRGTDLQWAELRDANLQGADLRDANLQNTDLRGTDLRAANLQGAALQGANMRGAEMQGADLDYSCFPLWCGSEGIKIDRRLFLQLVAHFCAVDVDDEECKQVQAQLTPLAIQSHVAEWLFAREDC